MALPAKVSLRQSPGKPGHGHDRALVDVRSRASRLRGLARPLKCVFDLDLEHCPNCGGEPKIIAAILEQLLIERILTHLGLQARAPPRSPARGQALRTACASSRPHGCCGMAVRAARTYCVRCFSTGAKLHDRQGRPTYDIADGPPRSGSPARNGPLSTLKVAIKASRAGSGHPMDASNGV